jgi:adenylate cyclase class 1
VSELIDVPDLEAIKKIEHRFMQVNALRLQRTRDALSIRQQGFIDLLPLLFHFNNPSLPGYCHQDTPCGITQYMPGRESLSLPRNVTQSLKRQQQKSGRAIQGLYLMGSTGSIAHSRRSDFDVWVCTRPNMTIEESELLSRKCEKITEWAKKLGVEAYFFLMDPDKFRSGMQGELSEEGCGSTQHFLLLDEFYRTAILVAGRKPAWWLVPLAQQHVYELFLNNIFKRRMVEPDHYLDFGPVNEFPVTEFLGAGMWQLYKAIDSPHKSAIKLMIADIYAAEYPNTIPLSQRYKEALYKNTNDPSELDPYILAYRVIEQYLMRKGDTQRLDMVRRCFYIKVGIKASKLADQPHLTWRENLLIQLLEEWQWGHERIAHLDDIDQWTVHEVAAERKLIVAELVKSYQALTEFGRQYGSAETMNASEMSILGRKLYAAFERKPGKVEFINPNISSSLEHQDLVFICIRHKDSRRHVWEVYPGRAVPIMEEPISRAKTLIELLSWCRINGVLTKSTYTYLDKNTSTLNLNELHQLVDIALDALPYPPRKLKQSVFTQPARYQKMMLVINAGREGPDDLPLSDQSNPLCYGKNRHNLVESIDLVLTNSWNEVLTKHFSGAHAIKQCLYLLLNLVCKQVDQAPEFVIRCLGIRNRAQIRTKMVSLVEQVNLLFGHETKEKDSRLIIECGRQFFMLSEQSGEGIIEEYESPLDLFSALGAPQSDFSPIVIDSPTLKSSPLDAISRVLQKDHIQVFYELEKQKSRAKVYIVDEKGSLFFYTTPFSTSAALLNPLLRFLRSVLFRQQTQLTLTESQLLSRNIHFWEIIRSRPDGFQLKPVDIEPEANNSGFFTVQAIGDGSTEARMKFTIYCNHEEFSELEYGDELYSEVARYILSARKSKERYPCYLTDLELAKSDSTPFPPGSLQTVHYLRQKSRLEKRLNEALQKIKV